MNTLLILQHIHDHFYKVYYENGVYIGDFVVGDDGYFDYWPELHNGAISSWHLFDLHQNLEALNKEWDNFVQSELTEIHNKT